MSISVLIVDDEPLARRRIRALLAREADVEVVQECADGPSAVEAIRRRRPDLVFLDVQMPEMSGFEVLREAGGEMTAAVVFVTAYEQFSLQAFEVHALDYLLKPFQRRRFQEALRRARQQLSNERELAATRVRLAALVDAPPGPLERLAVRTATKVTIVRVREIDWIQGDGNYVRVHVGSAAHLLRQTMKSLVAQLDPRAFLRIHNSYIVNVERVRELLPWSHGEYVVVLEGGKRLISGRSYGASVRQAFAL